MDRAEKLALLDRGLTRAAEAIGDVTPVVMARYYARFPDAAGRFEHHGMGRTAALEGEMVETCLYCLMHCIERPTEIEILLDGSIPHHHFTLNVPIDWYQGLLDTVIDVIAETVPADAADEQHLWDEIRGQLGAVFTQCRALLPGADPIAALR
ncbi:MAG: hypothetical protein CVT74_10390 [Alphaproteobacteria bacterium HGW-Alphaproteobacteria-13]|jgi:hypothetical protein|nr:MAG: hypothetical protein CVT74_10390 [Alphaproteobacteria bacterium HGW-Alphaproteobacteria-13]